MRGRGVTRGKRFAVCRRTIGVRALQLAVCFAIALGAGLARAQPEVVVLLEATDAAVRMHESLAGGASGALRSLRAEVGDRARVVRRASLGRRLAECDAAEPACAEAIVRALRGARVLCVRVEHTRGGHVPILRDGRRVGHRTLLATDVIAGWLGETSERREHLPSGATDAQLLELLRGVVREQILH